MSREELYDPDAVVLSADPRLEPPPGGRGSPAERAARMIDEDPQPGAVEFALSFYKVTAEQVLAARKAATSADGTR